MAKKRNNYSASTVYDEAIRTLRTNILFSDIDQKVSKIVITSSLPDEGKSTIALELSRSLAQNVSNVVLVGCDLRNPSIIDFIENDVNYGVTNVLMKKIELENAIVKDLEEPTLDILLAGPIPPNPAELVSSNAMKALIAELDEKYDYVIIDTPPVGIITDAAILSTISDGVLLVVKAESTKKDVIKNAIENIKKVNSKILGIVLTHVNTKGSHYGGYYRYYAKEK